MEPRTQRLLQFHFWTYLRGRISQIGTHSGSSLSCMCSHCFSVRRSWANNCAANANTNGVDRKLTSDTLRSYAKLRAKGMTRLPSDAIGLPSKFQPLLSPVDSNASDMVSYLLPDNITGIVSCPAVFAASLLTATSCLWGLFKMIILNSSPLMWPLRS